MHTLPSNTYAIIAERAHRTTNIAIAKAFLAKAIHPAEVEIWDNCIKKIELERQQMLAEECRNRQVAKERWDKAERDSEQEYVWAVRYLELTNPVLLGEILACANLDDAIIGRKSTEKTEPASSVWLRKLNELMEKDARTKAESCNDFSEAARAFQCAEEDSGVADIWFARYIALRYI